MLATSLSLNSKPDVMRDPHLQETGQRERESLLRSSFRPVTIPAYISIHTCMKQTHIKQTNHSKGGRPRSVVRYVASLHKALGSSCSTEDWNQRKRKQKKVLCGRIKMT